MRGEVTGLQLIAIYSRQEQSARQVNEKQGKNIWLKTCSNLSLPSLKIGLTPFLNAGVQKAFGRRS
jgi:hypothetical protein